MDYQMFQSKQEIACKKATHFIAKWMKDNNQNCQELYFDRKIVSLQKDFFKYRIRAIDSFNVRTYFFELTCRGSKLEMGYTAMSQNPKHQHPGEKAMMISDYTAPQSEYAFA